MALLANSFFAQVNFFRLFVSFFLSEFGGFLTNTAILIHINKLTEGSLFYLGLAQVLLVLPLAIGTALGGAIGEAGNKKSIMIRCEALNMLLVASLIWLHESVVAIVLIRAVIVLSAGIYGPSRQSIVQEVIDNRFLRAANSGFSSSFALFHAVSPFLGVYLYNYFDGIKEIFALNAITYAIGTILLIKMHYSYSARSLPRKMLATKLCGDIKAGVGHVLSRRDLFAIQLNFLIGGIAMGVFYPTILPYVREVYAGGEEIFARMMFCLSCGAIIGALLSPLVMKRLPKGKILVTFAFLQAGLILFWTTLDSLWASCLVLFIWGLGSMISTTAYLNYVQVNVAGHFRTRTFSVLDLTISASSFIGAVIVMIFGSLANAADIIALTALLSVLVMIGRSFSPGLRVLYRMPT